MTLLDSNIILDVISRDPVWFEWSSEQMTRRAASGPLLINEVVYAEISARMDTEGDVRLALTDLDVRLARIPVRALFLAGRAFRRYRSSGGVRTGVLPDFFIGAHAQAAALPLVTRDLRRYRTFFPDVELITPAGQ